MAPDILSETLRRALKEGASHRLRISAAVLKQAKCDMQMRSNMTLRSIKGLQSVIKSAKHSCCQTTNSALLTASNMRHLPGDVLCHKEGTVTDSV